MLDAAETAMKKQVLISAMNEQQINEYALLTNRIGTSVKFSFLNTGSTAKSTHVFVTLDIQFSRKNIF